MSVNLKYEKLQIGIRSLIQGDFFFSSSHRTLQARELKPLRVGLNSDPSSVLMAVSSVLRSDTASGRAALIVGAIPFSSQNAASLFLAKDAIDLPPLGGEIELLQKSQLLDRCATIREVPPPEIYHKNVETALRLLECGTKKIVLSRTLDLYLDSPINIPALIGNLVQRNPSGFIFCIPRVTEERSAAFIGGSPELLLRKSGRRIVSNPLAGSIPRGTTAQSDRDNAARLLSSAKDRYEHAVVVEAVAHALRPFCSRLDVPTEPSLISTPSIWHLSTTVRGELLDPDVSSLELALALHPTPAVCGHPSEAARLAIADLEGFDRDLYAGLVGWSDAHGDGEWAVALRCADVCGRDVRLFAGAGIVAGSRPETELAETAAKFQTMLDALGIIPKQSDAAASHGVQAIEA